MVRPKQINIYSRRGDYGNLSSQQNPISIIDIPFYFINIISVIQDFQIFFNFLQNNLWLRYSFRMNSFFYFYIQGIEFACEKIILLIIFIQRMSWLCCNSLQSHSTAQTFLSSESEPEPLKFRLLKSLKIINPILSWLVLPGKKQKYKFDREKLHFLQYGTTNHIPFLYFQSPKHNIQNSVLFVYCHGSGCNLNSLYNFGLGIRANYGISVLLYDYTGDGESQKQFRSYQSDLKVILAWALKKGFRLSRIVICGFSIGSYSALLLKGSMPRILISPICGIMSYIEGTTKKYEGQVIKNIENAEKISAKVMIIHGSDEMIPYSHAQILFEALKKNNEATGLELYKIDGVQHLDMPNMLIKKQFAKYLYHFLSSVKEQKKIDAQTENLQNQLLKFSENIKESK